jgi:hypothetical protein
MVFLLAWPGVCGPSLVPASGRRRVSVLKHLLVFVAQLAAFAEVNAAVAAPVPAQRAERAERFAVAGAERTAG